MKLDSQEQKANLLEVLARAHKSPAEVPALEELRMAIITAEVPKPPAEED